MITSIQGLLVESTPLRAVLELNGLGYEVHVPITTAEKLPAPGAKVKLHTLVIYREDAQTLYGFTTVEERDFFQLLIDNVRTLLARLQKIATTSGPVFFAVISAIRNCSVVTCIKYDDTFRVLQNPH
jgi:Holliday junction resolvasome RuvABC DNA-binding subunit